MECLTLKPIKDATVTKNSTGIQNRKDNNSDRIIGKRYLVLSVLGSGGFSVVFKGKFS